MKEKSPITLTLVVEYDRIPDAATLETLLDEARSEGRITEATLAVTEPITLNLIEDGL